MRFGLIFIYCFYYSQAFACSEILQSHQAECQAQERFLKMQDEFKKLSIDINDLRGFKIPRALAVAEKTLKNKSMVTPGKEVLKNNPEWQSFQSGQIFIEKLNSVFLSPSDVLKLHKTMFNKEGGKLRTNQGITNPRQNIDCEENIINNEIVDYFNEFDLKTDEGFPLLEIEELKNCGNSEKFSATLVYYKGASVKRELDRWVIDFNDMIVRYEKGTDTEDLSPLDYMADMRRWFIAIAPFSSGNAEVANALSDYFLKRLGLIPLPLKDLKLPHLLKPENNRLNIKSRNAEVLKFFESCLYENKVKSVSDNCSTL